MDGDFVLGILIGFAIAITGQAVCSRLPQWHRIAWRAWWRRKSRYRGGRPRIDTELIGLIRQISAENPTWGAPRIHGELLKLGLRVAQSTVSKYMIPRGRRPTPGWLTFLRNHADGIAAIDMLSVPTLTFGQVYAFVVLGHERRKILHFEVTRRPNALWLARQITQAFSKDRTIVHLIRDNDGAYGATFRRAIRDLGIRNRPTRPYSPWQNGYVERVIGSIKRECLDHLIIVNAAHLRRVLSAYADYYNNDRTHLGLKKDPPNSRPIETTGRIVSRPILGGIHHRYHRK